MDIFSKEDLIQKLKEIKNQGWIKSNRPGNVGGVGNTLEDILGIEENNLPIPNAAEWELKCQRSQSSSLTTLFHMEPSPRALRFVPKIFFLKYGWKHLSAGKRYSIHEMSFRQTIHGRNRSDRGFMVVIDKIAKKALISFDSKSVDIRHTEWLKSVEKRVGLGELSPQPYWGFDDLFHKAGTKLLNCFYIQADVKLKGSDEYFFYNKIQMLQKFSIKKFLDCLANAEVFIDFDARTGHNHGTKFRMKQNCLPNLYEEVTDIT